MYRAIHEKTVNSPANANGTVFANMLSHGYLLLASVAKQRYDGCGMEQLRRSATFSRGAWEREIVIF